MTTYALDSNIISYFLRKEGNVKTNITNRIFVAKNDYVIPLYVLYEVKRWLLYKPTKLLAVHNQDFDRLYQNASYEAEMPPGVWTKAAEIYISLKQKGQLIRDADILIAAYCIVNSFVLVTRNVKDFERINGLEFENWY
jgi:tRNA(fMet)-specific endonuclease VapC